MSSSITLFPQPPPTRNTLTSVQRSQLLRTNLKLGKVLGSTPRLLDVNAPAADPFPVTFDIRDDGETKVVASVPSSPLATTPQNSWRRFCPKRQAQRLRASSLFRKPTPTAEPVIVQPQDGDVDPYYFSDMLAQYTLSAVTMPDLKLSIPPHAPFAAETNSRRSSMDSSSSMSDLLSASSASSSSSSSPPPRRSSIDRPRVSLARPRSAGSAPAPPGLLVSPNRPPSPPLLRVTPPDTDPHAYSRRPHTPPQSPATPEPETDGRPAFRIASEASMRRAKMERLRKRLGECVPVELVFREPAPEPLAPPPVHVPAPAPATFELAIEVTQRVDVRHDKPDVVVESEALQYLVGAEEAEDERDAQLALTRVPFLWRKRLDVIFEQE